MNLHMFDSMNKETILIWCGLGLVAGVIAKYLMPGKDKGGLISTTLLGIAGAFAGGAIGNYFGLTTQVGGLSIMSLVTAVVGAFAVLIVTKILKLLI